MLELVGRIIWKTCRNLQPNRVRGVVPILRKSLTVVVLLVGVSGLLSEEMAQVGNTGKKGQRVPVIFNQDESEFFVGTFGPIAPKTLDAYVESLSGKAITDLFINVNSQRTNYRSRVWEAHWDGYDPKAGDDQPFFAGIAANRPFERTWIKNGLSLQQQGVDYGQRLLAACRRNNLSGWISLRMNDSHYPNEPEHPYHSKFWKKHPQWHLGQKSLDYSQQEVRDHYLALVKEVLERYDMFGLELDFMRHGHYFRPGQEYDGVKLMNSFVKEVRRLTKAAGQRWGHPVKLAVRVPTRPWIARSRGLDAIAWAKQSWVDVVVVAPWWASSQNDVPVESWKGLLGGSGVVIAYCLEDGINSGAGPRRTVTVEEARGMALSALHRGADAIYLFNYFTGPYQGEWDRQSYNQFLADAGSPAVLRTKPRTHTLTLIDPWAEGEPGDPRMLPFLGQRAVFRIPIGPEPLPAQTTQIVVTTEGGERPSKVLLNHAPCPWIRDDGERHFYRVPTAAVFDGYNLVHLEAERAMRVTWLGIEIQ